MSLSTLRYSRGWRPEKCESKVNVGGYWVGAWTPDEVRLASIACHLMPDADSLTPSQVANWLESYHQVGLHLSYVVES